MRQPKILKNRFLWILGTDFSQCGGKGSQRNIQRTFLERKSIFESSLISLIFAAVEALLFTKTFRSVPFFFLMSMQCKWLLLGGI